jgi:uncharacterized membrane protein YqjE
VNNLPNAPAIEKGAAEQSEPSLSEIAGRLWSNTEELLRQQLNLARIELADRTNLLKDELKVAAVAAGLLYLGMLALTAGLILLLCEWLEPWLAALLVGAPASAVGYALGRREPRRIASVVTSGTAEEPNARATAVQARR